MAKRPSDLARRQETFFFDERPMELDGFHLKARSIEVIGRPTLAQFAAALDFALGCGDGSPYWIGELWNYGEGRADWRDKLEQSIRSQSAYTHKSLINLGYIVRNTSAKARDLAPSVGHVSEVAALEPEEQVEWMERSASEGLTVRELRQEIKTARRRKVIDGQADSMHTVEVMVRLEIEAASSTQAEDDAWGLVRMAVGGIASAKVIAAHAKGGR
jgi:hypothetical protein